MAPGRVGTRDLGLGRLSGVRLHLWLLLWYGGAPVGQSGRAADEDPDFDFNSKFGLLKIHYEKLQTWSDKNRVIIMLRPTESASLERIRQGFATKSVDIKGKSSNWGPHEGFVPLDPFFSKALIGEPSENPTDEFESKISSAKETDSGFGGKNASEGLPTNIGVVQLALTEPIENLTYYIGMRGKDGEGKETGSVFDVAFYTTTTTEMSTTPSYPLHFCYKKRGHPDVEKDLQSCGKSLQSVPLYVWAYGANPVTGDYDIWHLAPHLTSPLLNQQSASYVDELRVFPILGGKSLMAEFDDSAIASLNKELGSPQVFNHGPETYNLKWVQALDPRITLIAPTLTAPASIKTGTRLFPSMIVVLRTLDFILMTNPMYGVSTPEVQSEKGSKLSRKGSALSSDMMATTMTVGEMVPGLLSILYHDAWMALHTADLEWREEKDTDIYTHYSAEAKERLREARDKFWQRRNEVLGSQKSLTKLWEPVPEALQKIPGLIWEQEHPEAEGIGPVHVSGDAGGRAGKGIVEMAKGSSEMEKGTDLANTYD